MGVSLIVIRGALPGKAQASPVECGAGGATIKNNGPNTTYYRDEAPVSASVNDGSLGLGESVTLYGAQWFVVDEGTIASSVNSAALIVTTAVAATAGGAAQADLDTEVARATAAELVNAASAATNAADIVTNAAKIAKCVTGSLAAGSTQGTRVSGGPFHFFNQEVAPSGGTIVDGDIGVGW